MASLPEGPAKAKAKGLTDRLFAAGARTGRSLCAALAALRHRLGGAMEQEWDLRPPFLWLAPAAGAGSIFYLVAATEPVL
jgi:hypothetical protein